MARLACAAPLQHVGDVAEAAHERFHWNSVEDFTAASFGLEYTRLVQGLEVSGDDREINVAAAARDDVAHGSRFALPGEPCEESEPVIVAERAEKADGQGAGEFA